MCGIVGLISYDPRGMYSIDLKHFVDMLYVGALRGAHGTGIFSVADDASLIQLKIGGPPYQLFASEAYQKSFLPFVEKRLPMIAIGHNRYATTGKKTTAHAHPFHHGDITMVHNGTIVSWGKFKKEAKKFEVDSEAVCYLINKYGVEDVVSTIHGAWAIVLWNSKTKQLQIFKNYERPLSIVHRPTSKFYALASEGEMLHWIMDRANMTNIEVEAVPNNFLLTFPLGEDKPIAKKLESTAERAHREWKDLCDKVEKNRASEFVHNNNTSVVTEAFTPYKPAPQPPVKLYDANSQQSANWSGSGQKTGKVKLPNSPIGRESWVRVKALKDFKEGDMIDLTIYDYDKIPDTDKGFQLVCAHELYPDVKFICHVVGDKNMEALLEADSLCATIHSILKSNINTAISQHKVVVSDPFPVYENVVIPLDNEVETYSG